ncbi:hypothetical protein LJR225_004686 [Phenylobacterium sp. LjRoot225]|uniref:hypothetical protein n=1 Tax=Phenylobacterium sp. LjRoot225 TaxID=3342285 RepID=UPI003ED17219
MRIALCLSGQPRTWRSTRKSLLAFFVDHEVDVFFHTWREGDPAELDALVEAYAPRAWRVEARPLFVAEKRLLAERFPKCPPLTIFDMFHSVGESLALAEAAGQPYDLVARARFDTLFDGVWSGEVPGVGELVVSDRDPDTASCNDQFAIGRPAEMRAYGEIRRWLPAVLPELRGEWLRPERMLRIYLETVCKLTLQLEPIAMRLQREGQQDLPFTALVDDPLFHAAKHEDWEAFTLAHFPDLAGQVDFKHPSRAPLALDRALDAWASTREAGERDRLFAAPWPQRIEAIDAFLAEQAGEDVDLDDDNYHVVRLICAALLRRMDRREPLNLPSAVVHLLSDNIRDMRRVDAWLGAAPRTLEQALRAAPPGGLLARALAFTPPLDAFGHDIWQAG